MISNKYLPITVKSMEQDQLKIRLQYEKSLAKFAQVLYSEKNYSISESLSHLLNAANACRVYIFQYFTPTSDLPYISQIYEVCSPNVSSEMNNTGLQHLTQNLVPAFFFDTLLSQQVLQFLVADLAEPLKTILKSQQVLSVLLIPIFVHEEFWGFIGFDDTKIQRVWEEHDIELLKLAAGMIGRFVEREKTQQMLKNSVEKYKAIFEQAPIGIIHFDQFATITSVNSYFVNIMGSSSELLIGLNMISDLKNDIMIKRIRQTLKEGSSVFEGFYTSVTGGKTSFIRVTFEGHRNSNLEIIGGIGIVDDLTDSKAHEDAIKMTQEEQAVLLNSIETQIWYLKDTKTYGNVNRAHADFFGKSQNKMNGSSLYDVLPNDIAANWEEETKIVFETKSSLRTEHWIRNAIGKKRLISTIKSPHLSPLGEVDYVVCSAEDITEQHDALNLIRDSEEKYRKIFEAIPDLFLLVSNLGEYLEILGNTDSLYLPKNELLGKKIPDIFSPETSKLFTNTIKKTVDSQTTHEIEYSLKIDNQNEIFEARFLYFSEEMVGIFIRNMTNAKKSAQKLIEAQKMDSIGNLAGGIAHDFNNMLGGILGYASLLLEEEENQDKRDTIDEIISAARRSSELTKKLLAFGRRGKNLDQSMNLNILIEKTLSILKYTLSKNITIHFSLEDNIAPINADPSQIEQVVMNLCINGAESMGNGGNLLISTKNVYLDKKFCSIHQNISPGNFVKLTVADQGSGIPDTIQKHVFEPFFTTKKDGKFKGTGLGLAIVYGIVKNHRGIVEFNSIQGKGTEFEIYIPQGQVDFPNLPSNQILSEMKDIVASKKLLLLVEDEDIIRKMLSKLIEKLGYSILLAKDGVEAVEIFQKRGISIDGVILDMQMPNMAGKETYIKLRELYPNIPVLLSTGYGRNEEAQEILNLGVKDILMKPYQIKELSLALKKLFSDESN